MLTLKEVAKIFGVHWRTIRRWIDEGKIKAVHIGRTFRIEQEEVDRLKNESK